MRDARKTSGDPSTRAAEREQARERAAATLRGVTWPPALLSALERIRAGGFQAWLVGGTVRDELLGRNRGPLYDVATDLEPHAVSARFERVEPIGLEHGTVL